MEFRIEDLEKDHPARSWKESGDTFGFAKHLEELVNLLMSEKLIPQSKLEEFKRDKTFGRFFGFLSELRAVAFFLSCGASPQLQEKHAFPDIILKKDEDIGVEVKSCIEESTGNEILNLGRKPTKDEVNKYIEKGIRKLLVNLDTKYSKIIDSKPFILFINTMFSGLEMHVNDIKEPIKNYFKYNPKISAIIVDDRYDLRGEKFSFAVFLNRESKSPLSKKFLEKMRLSENLIKWTNM